MRTGRFSRPMDPHFRTLNASIGFDKRLLQQDIDGSRAWVAGLCRAGLITEAESEKIRSGLEQVRSGIVDGRLKLTEELEDIHMNVESLLAETIGETAWKLHTGRSRNEQVATDLRLWIRAQADEIASDLLSLIGALSDTAGRHLDVVMPAYTHLQRAQPVLFSHHLLAYAEMFLRDHRRFREAGEAADSSPLGAGACVGNQFGIDREFLAETLGFARMTRNSMDAVSDRDFACDFLYASVMFLMHVSRLSEDLIFWSSSECGFVNLDESVTSGSSMLPQKKNPDACELGRAKCGRVLGHLVALVSTLKGLPLAYNKDLQEDKEGVFDALDTVAALIPVFSVMIRTLVVDPDRTRAALEGGYLEALSVADYLTRKGVPFRKAHSVAGEAVRLAEGRGVGLKELGLADYRGLDANFGDDLFASITLDAALGSKDVVGGTARDRVRDEVVGLRARIEALRAEAGPRSGDAEVSHAE
jgi:argininosuccinate lyase